jgi:hypothetical protein
MGIFDRVTAGLARRLAAESVKHTRADARWSPALKVELRHLWLRHADRAVRGEPIGDPSAAGFRIFSQFEEDGIALALLASLGEGPRLFIDIGAGDGVFASNCANLAINLGFHGLFIDANAALVERTSILRRASGHVSLSARLRECRGDAGNGKRSRGRGRFWRRDRFPLDRHRRQ